MNFNEKQNQALHLLIDFLYNNDKYFYLFGYAGTGKTFLINHYVNLILQQKLVDNIYICAPTHQALDVIESTFDKYIGVNFMTIHKLLQYKAVISTQDGSKIFKSNSKSPYLKNLVRTLVIIDECSMISNTMFNEIDLCCVKTVFMGDSLQLPPIGESISVVFQKVKPDYKYFIELTDIMRTNSPIIKNVTTEIRNCKIGESICSKLIAFNGRTFRMFHKNSDPSISKWLKFYISRVNQTKMPIIITWKNCTSDYYNNIIRKFIHANNYCDNYLTNDQIIFKNYYSSPLDEVKFYTSNIVKIINISTQPVTLFDWITMKSNDRVFDNLLNKLNKLSYAINVDTMVVQNKKNHNFRILTVNRNDLSKYQKMLINIKHQIKLYHQKYNSETHTKNLWKSYHEKLIDPYANISFGYSITSHKAQGSTFQIVFVDVTDIALNKNIPEMHKSLYTSAGRAAEELIFIL